MKGLLAQFEGERVESSGGAVKNIRKGKKQAG